MKKTTNTLVAGLLCTLCSATGWTNENHKTPGSPTAYEVQFLSVNLGANGLGTVVASPCDKPSQCKKLYARIDLKTVIAQNNRHLSLQEARSRQWAAGVLAIDDLGNATTIRLFGGPD